VGPDRLVAELEAELAHEPDHIGVGLFCDAYPPIEQELGVTRLALQVLVERPLDIRVITKGLTVWRDVDLLAGRPRTGVNISLCSTAKTCCGPTTGPPHPASVSTCSTGWPTPAWRSSWPCRRGSRASPTPPR
jgi:hypothetical protein